MLFLAQGLKIVDLILGFFLSPLKCFNFELPVDLERGGGDVSESSESDLESAGFIIADIIVLVTVPKKP